MDIKFASGDEMLEFLGTSDLYSPDLEMYVFMYNEAGGICYYYISKDEAIELEKKARAAGEYWSAFLGIGGYIWDDPEDEVNPPNPGCSNIDFCEAYYDHKWMLTSDVLEG